MIVEQVWTGNAYRNFNYLIVCGETGEAMAVDPLDHERCLSVAKNNGWQITSILNTHEHFDHTGGNEAVVAATGHAAVADDTGLEVDALSGAPGVHTARYAGESATYADNVAKLLADLGDADRRTARFRTAVAVVTPAGEEVVDHNHHLSTQKPKTRTIGHSKERSSHIPLAGPSGIKLWQLV